MYGLVNKAIEDLISERFGVTAWERIKQDAGVQVEAFLSMSSYPDEITYNLVGAASRQLGVPADKLLEEFGEYWTLYTAEKGYGELLRMGGNSFREFLLNLHNLHTHIALSFPDLTPPSFWCTDVTDASLRLHYRSERRGLAPMVVGLLRGLGKMFQTRVGIEHSRSRNEGSEHDEFLIRFG